MIDEHAHTSKTAFANAFKIRIFIDDKIYSIHTSRIVVGFS
jgi:hypothetical protein